MMRLSFLHHYTQILQKGSPSDIFYIKIDLI